MALFRCGSGNPIDITNPDVTWLGNISADGSKTIAVTQKPKVVIHVFYRNGTSNIWGFIRINDIENQTYITSYYASDGYITGSQSTGSSGVTVTDTSVTVPGRTYATRNFVYIYY